MKKLIIIYFAVFFYSHSFSQTIEFLGSITQNTVWDYDTVKITGNVTVNSGSTLTINEGSLIQFQGNYKISSVGSLHLLGSKEKNIVFTINDTTGYYLDRSNIGWGGLELNYLWDGGSYGNHNSNDSTIIEHCIFEYSKVGAITIENFSKIRISNTVFQRNYGSIGSGINLYYSNALIYNCSFFENYAYNSGGAMYLWSASPKIYNSSFINNKSSQGGALDITGGDNAWLINNIFYYNSSYNGGAIKFHGFYGIMANNIICYNKAVYGGGAIYGGSGDLLIVNNTICNNSSDYAPGIYVSGGYHFINSIIWGNGNTSIYPEQIYISDSRNNPSVQNCVIEKGEDYNMSLFTIFDNVYFDNPNFLRLNETLTYNRDSIIAYWSIDTTSICADKGINTYYRSVELNLKNDINFNNRVSNEVVDIGAFEFQNSPDIPNFIFDNVKENDLIIYPNPTNGKIWIDLDSKEILTIELFDMSGKLIQSRSFYRNTQIDISQFPQGIYNLLIKDKNKTLKTNKIIKY
jgi:predicted outer membrane repeat protein